MLRLREQIARQPSCPAEVRLVELDPRPGFNVLVSQVGSPKI